MTSQNNTNSNKTDIQTATKTNTLAIVGFILAFLLPLIGLILSIVSISQINKRKEGGKGLAIAGIIISSLILLIQIIFFSIAFIGAFSSATNTTSNSNTQSSQSEVDKKSTPVETGIGQSARDGKFEFTVTGFSCGATTVGSNPYLTKKAQGQYCTLNLSVKNIGEQAQSLFSSNQYLLNGNTKYSADDLATMYNTSDPSSTWYNNINPGNSVSGSILFDVPVGVTPTQAELHDSAFSGGVRVKL